MPVKSERQRRFLGAELNRKPGQRKTKMTTAQLKEYLRGSKKGKLQKKKVSRKRKA